MAIGAAGATVSGRSQAGAVVVLYGSSSGVSATRRTVIHQNSASVPGAAEAGDLFGSSLSAGDLDRDGYTDLVVGSSNESIGDRQGVGAATVLWGGPSGLYGGKGLPQPSTLSEFGNFGNGVATGDFDGDGDTDVTVTGRDHTRLYNGPFTRTSGPTSHTRVGEVGTVYEVTAGDLTGDGAAERVYPHAVDGDPGGKVYYFRWTGMTHTVTELAGADGFPGAIADIDGDGYGDLVLGDSTDPTPPRTSRAATRAARSPSGTAARTAPTPRRSPPSSTRTPRASPARARRATPSARLSAWATSTATSTPTSWSAPRARPSARPGTRAR